MTLLLICHTTHSYVHDSFLCEQCLIHTCDMMYSNPYAGRRSSLPPPPHLFLFDPLHDSISRNTRLLCCLREIIRKISVSGESIPWRSQNKRVTGPKKGIDKKVGERGKVRESGKEGKIDWEIISLTHAHTHTHTRTHTLYL